MSKYVVGITGSIATGKTHVTDTLKSMGAQIVDADEVSRHLTAASKLAKVRILFAFGKGVFHKDGQLNRRALGDLIFADDQKRLRLNGILHPMILRRCKRMVKRAKAPVVFLSAPLLFECGMEKMCHEVWCTFIPETEQLKRLCLRDQMTKMQAVNRIQSQMSALEKAQKAALVIDTSGTKDETARFVRSQYDALRTRLNIPNS